MKYMKKSLALILSLLVCFAFSFTVFANDGNETGSETSCQHIWSDWNYSDYDDEPTCEHGGIETRYCFDCGEEETRTVPALSHTWSGWDDYVEATCGQGGTQIRYCYNCYEEQTRHTAATGAHEWYSWETVTASTVFKKGKAARECWVCGKVQTKALAKVKPFAKFGSKTYKVAKKKSLNLKKKLKFGKGDKVVKWKSSNKKIATISSKGVIKAKKKGTVKITAKLKSGKVATCKIKVTKAKKSSGGKVYWVPRGKVYHCTKSCPTLSRSRVIKSGSKSKCPKPRPCKVCYY